MEEVLTKPALRSVLAPQQLAELVSARRSYCTVCDLFVPAPPTPGADDAAASGVFPRHLAEHMHAQHGLPAGGPMTPHKVAPEAVHALSVAIETVAPTLMPSASFAPTRCVYVCRRNMFAPSHLLYALLLCPGPVYATPATASVIKSRRPLPPCPCRLR